MRWIWTYLRTSGSNFHEVVPGRIYRSAAPEASDLVKLRAKFGIDTLLDLRQASDVGTDRRTPSEKLREYQRLLAECKRLGIKHVSVPFDDKAMPLRLQIDKALAVLDDPSNRAVQLFCNGGRHRSGGVVARYRVEHQGWTAEAAYDEAKKCGFYSAMGHGPWKDVIFGNFNGTEKAKK